MTEGRFVECNVLSATKDELEPKTESFNIFPNPSSGLINIAFQKEMTGELKVYTTTGMLIAREFLDARQTMQLDVSDVTSGFYIAAFVDKNGRVTNSHFIKG